MSFSLFSTSSELAYPGSADGYRCPNLNVVLSKAFVSIGDCTRRGYVRGAHSVASKSGISCHLIPGHLEGSFMQKKWLEEPRKKLEFVRTLLIDNYDSYTYNIYQELSVINGLPPVVVRNDEWTWEDIQNYLYKEGAFDNIVISPGPGSPTCPADIGICLHLFHTCWDIPILGVCLGHQALGYAHGAQIVHANEPVHGRLSEIKHNGCLLFHEIPSGRNSGFKVVRYHSLVIDAESLPKELIPIAWTSSSDTQSFLIPDAYKSQTEHQIIDSVLPKGKNENPWDSSNSDVTKRRNIIMGIMHSSRPHYGLQFHPESVATSYGRQIFKNFREITEDYWLSFSPSFINQRNIKYTAHMQVPSVSRFFRELPRSRHVVNGNGQHYQGGLENEKFLLDAQKSRFGTFDMVNISHTGAGPKLLKLTWRKFDRLASQIGGARSIFCDLFGDNKAENTFWLDSSSVDKGRARFSFMGGKSGSLWKQVTFRLSGQSERNSKCGGYLLIEDAQGSIKSTFLEEGFLDFLNKELLGFCYDEKDYEGLPFDFYGGYIGYIGYDLKVECGMASNRHKSGTPDACFFFVDNLVVVDHHYDDVYLLSIHEGSTTVTSWLDETEQKLISLKAFATKKKKEQSQQCVSSPSKAGFLPDKPREQYIRDVQNCLKYIKDGESYELCLTTQNRRSVGEIDSLGLYLHLREKNPAPYAAFLNFSEENLCICCSSPERFLKLDRNGILEAKPIKGTVARGSTTEEDEQHKLWLQYSEKNQAENLMIVDLLRNDLGRVCEPGSVHVPNLMNVESYATVHTMVSTIRGTKQSDVSAVECVRAAFPGGSMTGAPKLRSMELLESFESCSRGIYSGSIGFFSYNGTFDLNIVIRTVVIHEGEASIGAGGAIVALSDPEEEYEEMVLKTLAPANAVMDFQ